MNNDNNMQNNNKPAIPKFLRLPPLLRIDFDKPVPFKQQAAIMGTVLVFSCFLFTIVYIQQLFSGNVLTERETADAAAETSTVATSGIEASSADTKNPEISEIPEKKEIRISSANKQVLKNMTTVTKYQSDVSAGSLILVNKSFPCHSDGENIQMLYEEMTDNYILSDFNVGLDRDVIPFFNQMTDDFASIYGQTDLMVACGYRSKETQTALMSKEESTSDEAEQWVAPPGFSEHQTGLAFDFDLNLSSGGIAGINYDGQGNYSWINNNCGQYGFILRYRENRDDITGYLYEPWHFRYVGFPHSQYIEDNDITLEEYMSLLHKHTADNAVLMEDRDGMQWCIYYVPADESGQTDVPVPSDYSYEISGDNMVSSNTEGCGGFIVTVRMGTEKETGLKIKKEEVSYDYSAPEPPESYESYSEESSESEEEYYSDYTGETDETGYYNNDEEDYTDNYSDDYTYYDDNDYTYDYDE